MANEKRQRRELHYQQVAAAKDRASANSRENGQSQMAELESLVKKISNPQVRVNFQKDLEKLIRSIQYTGLTKATKTNIKNLKDKVEAKIH